MTTKKMLIQYNLQFLSSYSRNRLQSCSSFFQSGLGILSITKPLCSQTLYDFGLVVRQDSKNCNSAANSSVISSSVLWKDRLNKLYGYFYTLQNKIKPQERSHFNNFCLLDINTRRLWSIKVHFDLSNENYNI